MNDNDISSSDANEMLEEWSKSASYWGEKDDRFIWLTNWLKSASSDEWHSMAIQWNWDYGIEPMVWIARQPNCDKATALDIYWNIQPDFYAASDFVADGRACWDMVACATAVHIPRRWHKGFYQRSQISWRPDRCWENTDMNRLGADESMKHTLSGNEIDESLFRRQIPPAYCFD
ncbi:MAG: DUF4274 domain-containing protein [Sphingomonadaceae bacterium]|nr:DUF4274 domain-containing protein [Sphingomonadaceae bacterium]